MTEPPYSLTAELTHRCPLGCLYCSNPLVLVSERDEMTSNDWRRILSEAARLGVVQVNLSGGEPLTRPDLEELIEHLKRLGVYSHLVTSGIGLTESRLSRLIDSGLESIQISMQSLNSDSAAKIAGKDVLASKLDAIRRAARCGMALTLNVVLSRFNLEEVEQIIDFAAGEGVDRLELANAQYYGWALKNREALIPEFRRLERASSLIERKREELSGRLKIDFVAADYYEEFPKPCMGGWASTALVIAADGTALPCLAAKEIDSIAFPSALTSSLHSVWYESDAFNQFRGTSWMKEPCSSCQRKEIDFGGCRCQAYLLTGDAANADPVCRLSKFRSLVDEATRQAAPEGTDIALEGSDTALEGTENGDERLPDERPPRLPDQRLSIRTNPEPKRVSRSEK